MHLGVCAGGGGWGGEEEGPDPLPPPPPRSRHRAHGIPNEFRWMALLRHLCQAALRPGTSPCTLYGRKKARPCPPRLHRGGSRVPAALLGQRWRFSGWAERAEPRALGLHVACPNAGPRLGEARRRSPRLTAVATNPAGSPPSPARLRGTPGEIRWSGPGPRDPAGPPTPPSPHGPLGARSSVGTPREASLTLRAPAPSDRGRRRPPGTDRGVDREVRLRQPEGRTGRGRRPRPRLWTAPAGGAGRGGATPTPAPLLARTRALPSRAVPDPRTTLLHLFPVKRPRSPGGHLTVTSPAPSPTPTHSWATREVRRTTHTHNTSLSHAHHKHAR